MTSQYPILRAHLNDEIHYFFIFVLYEMALKNASVVTIC